MSPEEPIRRTSGLGANAVADGIAHNYGKDLVALNQNPGRKWRFPGRGTATRSVPGRASLLMTPETILPNRW